MSKHIWSYLLRLEKKLSIRNALKRISTCKIGQSSVCFNSIETKSEKFQKHLEHVHVCIENKHFTFNYLYDHTSYPKIVLMGHFVVPILHYRRCIYHRRTQNFDREKQELVWSVASVWQEQQWRDDREAGRRPVPDSAPGVRGCRDECVHVDPHQEPP